jgi:hypothetical protein
MTEMLERRMMCAVLDVAVGDGAARAVTFVDADGTSITVSMKSGSALLRLSGEGLAQVTEGRDVVVSGTSVALESVSATGTSSKSTLAISATGGDGRALVGNITTDGAVKSIKAPGVVLTASLATGGPSRIELLGSSNATITLGGGPGKSSVYIRDAATDSDLESLAPISKLQVGAWIGTGGDDVVTAPSIAKATIAGAFMGAMNLSSAGTLTNPSGVRLTLLWLTLADFGCFSAMQWRRPCQMNTAPSSKFETVDRSIVSVSGDLKRLEANGATDLQADVGGSIGSLLFEYLVGSHVFAGVGALPPEAPIPARSSDFVAPSRIERVQINNIGLTFDSTIAASVIRRVNLAVVPDDRDFRDVIVADHVNRVSALISMASRNLRRERASELDNEVLDLGAVEVRAV